MSLVLKITPGDNVAVALHPIAKGETVAIGTEHIEALEDVPQGHKMAVSHITAGNKVIKYGYAIGHAETDIAAGQWVHTHNMKTNLSGEVRYTYRPVSCEVERQETQTFAGFLRKDGKAAIRNEVWIIPTVGCVNDIANKLARDNQDLLQGTTVEGLYAFTHPFGCSQTGQDHAQTRKLLASLAHHPKFLTCQDVEDEFAAGRELLKECVAFAGQFRRQPLPASKLIVGLKCGASDGLSGITANPAVGRFSDLLIGQGGSTILTEVPEMFGAEGMLMDRCINEAVFHKAEQMLNGFKDYFLSHHEVVYENPSPGNKKGGITTLEDKSCGCVQKGGTAPIVDVIGYAERVQEQGLTLLYGPCRRSFDSVYDRSRNTLWRPGSHFENCL